MNLEYDHYDQLIFFRHDKLFPFFINLTRAMIYAVKGAVIFLHCWEMLAEKIMNFSMNRFVKVWGSFILMTFLLAELDLFWAARRTLLR